MLLVVCPIRRGSSFIITTHSNGQLTLMATTLGEFSTSTGALGMNWTSPSSLASNWKSTSSCPTFVKLNLLPSNGCSTLSTRNSVGLFFRWRPSFSWAINPYSPGITYWRYTKYVNRCKRGYYYRKSKKGSLIHPC